MFGTEGRVVLPRPSNGINVVPSSLQTFGEILTTGSGPLGSISFGSSGRDPSGEFIGLGKKVISETEFIWLRRAQPRLPRAPPRRLFLTYKFEVNVRVNVFRDAGQGLIMCFASWRSAQCDADEQYHSEQRRRLAADSRRGGAWSFLQR